MSTAGLCPERRGWERPPLGCATARVGGKGSSWGVCVQKRVGSVGSARRGYACLRARQGMRAQESVRRGVCVRQPVWGVCKCLSKGVAYVCKGEYLRKCPGGQVQKAAQKVLVQQPGWVHMQRPVQQVSCVCVKVPIPGTRVQEPIGWVRVHHPLHEVGAIAR